MGRGEERKVWNCWEASNGVKKSWGPREDERGRIQDASAFNCRTRGTFKAGCKWPIKLGGSDRPGLIYERGKFLGSGGEREGLFYRFVYVCVWKREKEKERKGESSKVILFSWRWDRQAATQVLTFTRRSTDFLTDRILGTSNRGGASEQLSERWEEERGNWAR